MSNLFRTDLASEALRLHGFDNGSLRGADFKEEELFGFTAVSVRISGDDASRKLRKPKGQYFTLELEQLLDRGSDAFSDAVLAVAALIRRCISIPFESCLVAALGNPDITPDALGSLAASSIIVTRHLKAASHPEFAAFRSVSLCRTGVLGTTGTESALQIRALCAETRPDLVIAVDALAGADVSRLCRTVQICDTGIAPGSGVGNSRAVLDAQFLGVPVIALGVPTVIDAASLGAGRDYAAMFVTPRDIDASVRRAARLIGYGIDLAMHDGLTVSDVDMLIG